MVAIIFQTNILIWLTTPPPVHICPILPDPLPPPYVWTSFTDSPFLQPLFPVRVQSETFICPYIVLNLNKSFNFCVWLGFNVI